MKNYKAFKSRGTGLWGVGQSNSVLYDPQFTEAAAKRLAQLENGDNPPKSWHESEAILRKEGLL